MNTPAASIIIPVHNRPAELAHVLGQLAEQDRRDFEVVVVDDGSVPPVTYTEFPGGPPYPLRIIRHEKRSGIGKARNTGVKTAQADLLVFVDSDGDIPDRFWFEKHLALYEQAGEQARQAWKAGFVFHSEVCGISHTYWGRADTYSNWFGSAMTIACEVRDRHLPMHNTSTHRQVFDLVGAFAEDLEVCEDVEWSFRCLENGVGLFFIPGAPVGHFDRNTFREFWHHYHRFGKYALSVRKKCKRSAYEWLFPRGPVSAILLFFPLTSIMTAYVCWCWLFRSPRVLAYLPALYLANVACYIGIGQSLLTVKNK